MNNQRRHQLEQNVLAIYLGNFFSRVQPILKPLAIAAVVALAVFLIYSLYKSFSTGKTSEAWTEYYFNLDGDADAFSDLAEQYGRSSAGQWARYAAASGNLRDGIDALYVNRPEGVSSIQKAIDSLEKLKGASIKELQIQVLHSLGKAHESLGQLPEAISYYEELVDSQLLSEREAEPIKERLTYLRTDDARNFYAWFERLDPKPALPPALPSDLSLPPDSPTITFDPVDLPALPGEDGDSDGDSDAGGVSPQPSNSIEEDLPSSDPVVEPPLDPAASEEPLATVDP